MWIPGEHRRTLISAISCVVLLLADASPALGGDSDPEELTRSRLKEVEAQIGSADPARTDDVPRFNGDLEAYLAYSMKKNPKLRASFERWRASIHRIAESRRLPNPKITYGFFILSVETRLGPQRHRVGLSQTFPWPTKLTAGADAQAAMSRAAERRFDAKVYRLKARVERAYWKLWVVREMAAIKEELLGISRSSAETVRARLVVGEAALSDQQQVDLFVSRLEDSIDSLAEDEIAAQAELAAAVGVPVGTEMPTTATAPAESLPQEPLEELRRLAREHPLLDSYEFQAEGSEARAESLRADRLPSFTVGLDWIEVGDAPMPDVEDSGRDALVVGVGVSLPLWQSNYRESVDAALADAAASRWEGRAASDQALSSLEAELARVRDSYRRIRLHRHTLIPQASAALDSVLGSYTAGRASVASVLLAERELLELRVALARVQAEHQLGWAMLEETVGRSLDSRPRGSGEIR